MKSDTLYRSLQSYAVLVGTVQLLLFALHYISYISIIGFFEITDPQTKIWLGWILFILSLSFLSIHFIAQTGYRTITNWLYILGSTWLGTVHFIILFCTLMGIITLFHTYLAWDTPLRDISIWVFAFAMACNIYAVISGLLPRLRYKNLNLFPSWRGKKAVFFSDAHFGNAYGSRRVKYLAQKIAAQNPDIVLISGDFFDGPIGPYEKWAKEFTEIVQPPLGIYYVTGNHEEYQNPVPYLHALQNAGVKILTKDSVVVSGVRIAGIADHLARFKTDFKNFVNSLPTTEPILLLKHSPKFAEHLKDSSVTLMLSGHTHVGQVWPFTWLTYVVYKGFNYGYKWSGKSLVYTSSGAQGWGPPQRWFAPPEIVVFGMR